LTNRLLGFQSLVQAATGSMLTAVLATMMSTTNLALMFYYDFWLALIGVLLVSILMAFLLFCSYLDLGLQRPLAQTRGELSALVFQLIGGVSKIKVSAAQARAFERWTRSFTERVRISYRSNLIQSNVNAVMPVYNTTSLIIFIGYLAHFRYTALPTSDFLALTAAYGAFVGAINTAGQSLTGILTIIPLAERFAPILSEQAEVASDHPNPGVLEGRVEVSHVSFRYGPDAPLILKDVSLRAEPGEFIAIVGPSGSGKSTLLRQLLGFETPTQGRVLYDGQDLSGVNIPAVRRQLGVVLQNGQLMPGSIVSNIIGSSLLTLDDAWHAAEIAGIADDIRAMPMGMQTVVSEGGGAFSGGQKQRLLIARAVVSRPRIILLDEATSALDSQTQEQVSRQLNALQATRIVIAHRLSTIEKADRIYVLKDGTVEQVGTFEELIAVPGTFQELARRQLL
jgi:ABC-type bacteriocin/lantibiotic exporter with double-glycine peptidase domain